jgi:hypothetical protein
MKSVIYLSGSPPLNRQIGGCGSGRKIGVDNSKLAASTFRSRAQVLTSFPSTKLLTQGAIISPRKFVSTFNWLQINGSLQKDGQKLLLSREIDAT